MKLVVKNGPVGKLFRTLGFILVLVPSVYFGSIMIEGLSFVVTELGFLESIVKPIIEILDFIEVGYYALAWAVGLILLVWTLRKGIIARVLTTVLLLVLVVVAIKSYFIHIVPLYIIASPPWLFDGLDIIFDLIKPILDISKYILMGIYVATFFMLWYVFAYKRPVKISVLFLRIGSLIFFIGLLVWFIGYEIDPQLISSQTFLTAVFGIFGFSHVLYAIGSAVGVIGFATK
ncbi:MAG: hypothetical protein WC278_00645 [Bacilli bacterium]